MYLVDASRAGEGNLEISVNHSGRNIPNQVNSLGNSRFEVQFTPQEVAVHYCNILFNGEPVPGKPIAFDISLYIRPKKKKRGRKKRAPERKVFPFLFLVFDHNTKRMIDDCAQYCLAVLCFVLNTRMSSECRECETSIVCER